MKKLIYLICIAALFFAGTHAATAQSTFPNEPSETNVSTNGRFGSDVDLFFDVNDWADLQFSKWFGFLRMQDLNNLGWETGAALKFEKAYVGFFYRGRYNSGTQTDSSTTTHNNTGTTFTGVPYNTASAVDSGINHNNHFGFLLGIGNNGFKVTIEDSLTTKDYPVVTSGAVGATIGAAAIPANTNFYYRTRAGSITPKVQWGASEDMSLGKFKTRPSASVALAVAFNEIEAGDFTKTTGGAQVDINGDPIPVIENFANNRLSPSLGFDTGAIKFFEGEWGTLAFGASEEFGVSINGEGNNGAIPWKNKLMPYAVFDYTASEFFKLGAQLSIPIYIGWNNSNNSYFAVGGSPAIGASFAGSTTFNDLPALDFGFQYRFAFFDSLSGKTTFLSRLSANFGIKVNLPGYASYGTYTYTPAPAPTDPDNPINTVTITESKTDHWFRPTAIQAFTSGLSFFITDNVILDAIINMSGSNFDWKRWGLTETVVLSSLMISVKH